MIYYMAYGSNLNLRQMSMRCPDSRLIGTGYLRGYALSFRGLNVGHLTIDRDLSGVVPVGIFEVSVSDIMNLDRYEGYPTYYDRVIMKSEEREMFVYIMRDGFGYCLPMLKYLDICKVGYDDLGFSKEFLVRALKRSIERKQGIE